MNFSVFVVDDEEMMTDLMEMMLSDRYPVEVFSSSEACLERLELMQRRGDAAPGLVVLDVGLPGIDGYACCRMIKEMYPEVPVMFVSGYDTIEARMKGYDAGGDDFVVKPVDNSELLSKVQVFSRRVVAERSMSQRAAHLEQTSNRALAGMDEAALVMQFLSRVIASHSLQSLGDAVAKLMRAYRLEAAVQLRGGGMTHDHGVSSNVSPLEKTVLDHSRTLGPLFELKTRIVFNSDHVTLMVANLPVEHVDYCRRAKENLALVAHALEAKVTALESAALGGQCCERGRQVLQATQVALTDLHQRHDAQRAAEAVLNRQMQEKMAESFAHLGLTDLQETHLTAVLQEHFDQLNETLGQGTTMQSVLGGLLQELASVAQWSQGCSPEPAARR